MIEQGLAILELAREDLDKMRKLDIKKAMLVRLLRKQTSTPLEWIAKELTIRVRSSVSRADHNLTNELKENKKLQKIWRKMQQISSCPLFSAPAQRDCCRYLPPPGFLSVSVRPILLLPNFPHPHSKSIEPGGIRGHSSHDIRRLTICWHILQKLLSGQIHKIKKIL
jgi:hypothetical protein